MNKQMGLRKVQEGSPPRGTHDLRNDMAAKPLRFLIASHICRTRRHRIFQPSISSRHRQKTLQEKPVLPSYSMWKGSGVAGQTINCVRPCGEQAMGNWQCGHAVGFWALAGTGGLQGTWALGSWQRCGLSWSPAPAWFSGELWGINGPWSCPTLSVSHWLRAFPGESITSGISWESDSYQARTIPRRFSCELIPVSIDSSWEMLYRPGEGIRAGHQQQLL